MALSATQRSQSYRARMRDLGYKEVRNLWIKPEHEDQIRAFAASLHANTSSQEVRRSGE